MILGWHSPQQGLWEGIKPVHRSGPGEPRKGQGISEGSHSLSHKHLFWFFKFVGGIFNPNPHFWEKSQFVLGTPIQSCPALQNFSWRPWFVVKVSREWHTITLPMFYWCGRRGHAWCAWQRFNLGVKREWIMTLSDNLRFICVATPPWIRHAHFWKIDAE